MKHFISMPYKGAEEVLRQYNEYFYDKNPVYGLYWSEREQSEFYTLVMVVLNLSDEDITFLTLALESTIYPMHPDSISDLNMKSINDFVTQ